MAKGSSKPETAGTNVEADQPGPATDHPDRLIEQLREAVRIRDDFLAIASHELRNPLTPILLGLQLIRAAEKSG
ncbi:MAG TPA: histidine kinase dimerization/phospho-acceptor domain-containing protein, partial [Candidatus Binatus sp.]|nr:histidine kinase dimerization/phospho-acceptor domain-containing protein [Candidatus Binatus sp.]